MTPYFKIELPYDAAIAFLGKMTIQIDICTSTFKAAYSQ